MAEIDTRWDWATWVLENCEGCRARDEGCALRENIYEGNLDWLRRDFGALMGWLPDAPTPPPRCAAREEL